MKQAKKKNTIIIFVLGIILLITAFFGIKMLISKEPEGGNDTYDDNIEILNEIHPVKILVYGEELYFRDTLKYEKITSISAEVLELDENAYERVVLVINDLNGTVELTEADYETIGTVLKKGGLDFYYYGTSKFDKIREHELCNSEPAEDAVSMTSALYYKRMANFNGLWTEHDNEIGKRNKENQGMILVANIVRCIKSNN